MKTLHLTRGFSTLLDDDVYERFKDKSCYVDMAKHTQYAVTKVRGKPIRLHRLILGLEEGDKIWVDHRNRNGLDNRRENLRLVTPSQNAQNTGVTSRTTSGVRGVTYERPRKRWRATGTIAGVTENLYQGPSYMIDCDSRKVWEMNNGR